nr:prolipoprotein diacylglyceryl transferase family protein [Niabella ginsengisoli]
MHIGSIFFCRYQFLWLVNFSFISYLRFFYVNNIKPLYLLDATAPGFMIAYCIGRLGCHVSGDGDWGRINNVEKPFAWIPDGFWAYQYPHNLIREGSIMLRCDWGNYCYQLDQAVFPTSLWEAIICFLLFLLLWSWRKK